MLLLLSSSCVSGFLNPLPGLGEMQQFIHARLPLSTLNFKYTPQMLVRLVRTWLEHNGEHDKGAEDTGVVVGLIRANVLEPAVNLICEFAGSEGTLCRNAFSGAVHVKSTNAVVAGDVGAALALHNALEEKMFGTLLRSMVQWPDIFPHVPFSGKYMRIVLLAMLLFDFLILPGQTRQRHAWCRRPFSVVFVE